MEGIIRVTPEQLEAAAAEFSSQGTALGNLTSQMMQLIEGLGSVWEGEAACSYMTKFRQLEDDIQRILRMVQEHSSDLTDMAQIYHTAEAENQEEIAALAGDVIV